MVARILIVFSVAVLFTGCGKMNEIQPNSELLPGYSMKSHSDRVSLERTNQVRDILAAEWVADDVVAIVAHNGKNEEALTRDSVSVELYSIETGRKVPLSSDRGRHLKPRVFEVQEFERRKVPEDEKKLDFYVASEDHFAGADYLSKGVFYSRSDTYDYNKESKVRWKAASFSGQDIRLMNHKMFEWGEFGFDFVQVETSHQWSLDVSPSARYVRVRDHILDLRTENAYELQKGFLAANYAFSPSWDRLLLVYRPGFAASLQLDVVEFDVSRITDATPVKKEE